MARLTIRRTLAPVALLVACLALAPVASRASAESSAELPGPPKVVTGGNHVSGTSDELDGTVNPNNLETTYWFEYGPTNKYEKKSPEGTLKAEPAEVTEISETVTGMQAGWRYRLVAKNANGEVSGHEKTFVIKTTKKKTSKTVLNLTQPESVLVGETLVLGGTLTGTGNAGREVVLQASPYPYRAVFADVGAPILTNAAGGFSFQVPDLSTSTRFRVATVAGTPSLISKVVTGLAAVRVRLRASIDRHNVGLVRLHGTVSPAEVGARVYFQLERPPKQKLPTGKPEKPGKSERSEEEKPPTFSSKFSAVVKRATKRMSRFSLVVTIKDAGRYRAFVAVQPGPLASGHSQTISLSAAPAKHKKR